MHVASIQYIAFIKIVCKADAKDSNDDPFTDLDEAEVDNLWKI